VLLSEIASRSALPLPEKDCEIERLATLDSAKEGELSFFHSEKYLSQLSATKASAVILEERYAQRLPKGCIALVTNEPYLKLALVSALFAHTPGVSSDEPLLAEGCEIDPSVRFGRAVKVGRGTVLMAGSYIGDGVEIGEDCVIHPNVTIYHGSRIGDRCTIHSGTVIGSDGYGFAHTADGRHIKIHQLGNAILEDDVEIGANCCIDRGAIGDTVIRRGSKIDNLVQIGHNCDIGENSLIVAQVGISGSSILGRNVVMGGQSATAGHLKIGDFATVAARGGVTKSLEGGKIYGGFPAVELRVWRRMQAALSRLAKKRA
jgi:UDP-3-O-[3-hydroxymyristoyl] glucosamine N-acyltransferase